MATRSDRDGYLAGVPRRALAPSKPVPPERQSRRSRSADTFAWAAFVPMLVLIPSFLLAMGALWLVVRLVLDMPFWVFVAGYLVAGTLLFVRPVQRVVLARVLGARAPTEDEAEILEPVWSEVTQSVHESPRHFVLAVLDADELNAYACGGHLVVVTSYAVGTLPERELAGVLAHELSHHLGLHTIALTVRHWLCLPVLALARVGFFLRNVATAATEAFARRSPVLTALGTVVAVLLKLVAWVFLLGVVVSNALSNVIGRSSEFEADRRAVTMGFGAPLAAALRRFVSDGLADAPTSWRDKAFASHPPARTRIARIEALLRARSIKAARGHS
jgi:Zn-dependent protease with chaperone function